MFQDAGLKDKIIIVTGGARGIGRAIVNLFCEQNAKVHFLFNSSQKLADELLTEAKDKGWDLNGHQVDVRDRNACETIAQTIFDKHDRVDVLVNNSGIIRDNLLVALSEDDIQEVMRTNISGVFNMTSAVVPYMMSQRAGKIINISSVSAEKAGRGQANYAASKGAINAFTKAMAVELAPRNILVNAVAPGVIETAMSKEVREMAGDQALTKILLKRFGQPEDIAYAVGFLASSFADYITGEILHVDGGFKMA